MATAKKKKVSTLHLRLSKEKGDKIMSAVENKMEKENRSRNNCLETILVEYFKL